MKWFEVSPKTYQVRFYDKEPDKYVASFQLFVDGNRGFLYSLMGNNFYESFADQILKVMKNCHLKSIEASVSEAHYNFIKKSLSQWCDVTVVGPAVVSSRDMVWIKIEPNGNDLEPPDAYDELGY